MSKLLFMQYKYCVSLGLVYTIIGKNDDLKVVKMIIVDTHLTACKPQNLIGKGYDFPEIAILQYIPSLMKGNSMVGKENGKKIYMFKEKILPSAV